MLLRRTAQLLILALLPAAFAGQWQDLVNGKNTDGWQPRGECTWTVLADGTLLGQRRFDVPKIFPQWPIDQKQFRSWWGRQAWLYTDREFGEFDLHAEYLLPPKGNSGISIRDVSRGHYAIGEPDDSAVLQRTKLKGSPAHIGYEIQLIDPDNDRYASGSVYLFNAAKTGVYKTGTWNTIEIESRNDHIRVRLNGQQVSESAGDPQRSKTGPIGLQLHDQSTFVMFRNIRIRTY
jgi:3-keto-disaccharide hydrolase